MCGIFHVALGVEHSSYDHQGYDKVRQCCLLMLVQQKPCCSSVTHSFSMGCFCKLWASHDSTRFKKSFNSLITVNSIAIAIFLQYQFVKLIISSFTWEFSFPPNCLTELFSHEVFYTEPC